MVNSKARHVLREVRGECSNAFPRHQGGQILHRQRRTQANSLTLLNGGPLSLRNRVRAISRRRNVVLREATARRPAQRTLECHGFAAQIEELLNTCLEL